MRIVVLVKHVPEPTATWSFASDFTLDRGKVEGRLSELDEYAVEQAIRLVEGGLDAQITYLTVGPAKAVDGLRKALAMGGNKGVHVVDASMHGSDAVSTSLVLAKAARHGFHRRRDVRRSGDGVRPARGPAGHVRRRSRRRRRLGHRHNPP